MGIFSSSPKWTHAWVWEGPPEGGTDSQEKRAKFIANKYGIDRRSVEFYSVNHAMREWSRMGELRGPTPLPHYDDVITQQAAWHEITEGRGVIWHEKGDHDKDWPKETLNNTPIASDTGTCADCSASWGFLINVLLV